MVRLTHCTPDVDRLFGIYDTAVAGRSGEADCRPAAALPNVARLASPEVLLEIEATAVV